ncbi:probable ATP-dependent RNA helicase DHX34 [Phlebotomus argentipes]|uniref:probable ATP-dependent RNA helicase DHX34 n=1 Tax=Phlebotomus argentipes TaxID=94469 RepID=UPI002892AA53|nr:probable ATP-dependent RNA helicase DHX34 [Phlebotomus argentipes]
MGRKSSKRRHSDSSDEESRRKSSKHSSRDRNEETNLVNFSFLDFKADLTRVLVGFSNNDQIVEDVRDFWLFMSRYESLLKKSGQCILPEPVETSQRSHTEYSKMFFTNLELTVKFSELQGRLSTYCKEITTKRLKQFLQIVLHYLDFKQKEKFAKLKKLRKSQANLPVAKYKDEIIKAVQENRVVIIAGDTGCGKSTQIPQYLHESGFRGIACTQPRRIACISLSKRVAHEMLCEYGMEVGYQIRFERSKNQSTSICFITEGLLLRQLSTEANLSQYDVIVLDEIHERNLHGDFLLGVSKCLLQVRQDVKLILMSATINIKLFSDYFAAEEAKVIEVPGRLYPIKLHYMPQIQDVAGPSRGRGSEKLSPEPYIQILQMINQKYPSTERGDVLIFMSGINEITTVVDAAKEYSEKNPNWIILPLHSSLSLEDQDKVFAYPPEGIRKCIVSTNIAETSVTIDGIRFVVDSGKMKEMSFDSACKMQRLKEFWISKASAEQRKGRAGRTGPGVCYRLYAEKQYEDLESYSVAEIHRVPLERLLLQMISMGLPNARLFPFVEAPPMERIESAILSLKQHDALTANECLTSLGMALAKLPVDVSIGKMLLMGSVFQQLQPVLTLAAALSVQTPFTNRAYRDHECETARKELESDHGDPITLLNAVRAWLELKQAGGRRERGQEVENTKHWCRRRGLEEQRFYEITKLRSQFQDLLTDCGLLEAMETRKLTSAEKIIRHGELKQLRQLRKEHRMETPRKRKLLKSDSWQIETEDNEDDGSVDIRDVEFRLSNDNRKMQSLLSSATACSYRDVMTLKLILVSGLYPQVAIGDEFNYCKSPGQQFYHTNSKPFTSLHPMGYFANNPDVLQLNDSDRVDGIGDYRTKLIVSSRHQLLCYLSLLETTKPYLMNTLRMPAAQTLLLFAHAIDTNLTCSRIICDSWLCMDFPVPESGLILLHRASKLRRLWNKLLEEKLKVLTESVDEGRTKSSDGEQERLEQELWDDLTLFMNSNAYYTIRRLLAGDLKSHFKGRTEDEEDPVKLEPNPFGESKESYTPGERGGIYLTDNVIYGSVQETEWSVNLMDLRNEWECKNCDVKFDSTGIEKLQHQSICQAAKEKPKKESKEEVSSTAKASGSKSYQCEHCQEVFYSGIDILRHKRKCQVRKS